MTRIPAALRISLAALVLVAPMTRAEEEKKVETEVAVQVAKITRATLHRVVTAYGNIEPEPLASARLAPAQAGIIAEVDAVEGQRVEKGAVLFRLDSRAVDAAVEKAGLAIDFAQKNADRQKKLIAAEGTSEKLVLEAQQALAAAKLELATAKVQQSLLSGEAPLAGTVVSISARPGEPADATKPLAEIVDLDRLAASVRVPRANVSELHAGQKAQLLTGRDAPPVESSVTFVSPQVDPATDTVLVRLTVPKGAGLRPGQFLTARIFSEERQDRLAVPAASVVKDPDAGTVIALVEGDKATRKAVKVGLREGDLVEVEGEGLSDGQTVVTVGAYGLPKETKVRVLK
ncbi:MAG: efflux RND transporter periplasmic adaptor subunit [Chthoniobacter sp.]|uniref:efflux RND transporter periplasmic adaptor subunit n=1 Tax=Chthoniobacter sp. TaxID=2510640 RepID=UPI0032A15B02